MKIVVFALSASLFLLSSCGATRNSDCGLSKSLKILNIHDTKDAQILLVNNSSEISQDILS